MSHSKDKSTNQLAWWQLALTGVGCTIGTGYFLGSSIGISLTGPSIVFAFLLAAIGTYIVFHLLAKMTAADPQESSFCYYAEKAYGKWAGFSCGWNYWCSSILIMGSQLIALSILTKEWFSDVPLWVFASVYAVLSIAVILLGTRGFDRIEDFLAIIKTAAILMFIIIAIVAISGGLSGGPASSPGIPASIDKLFTGNYRGFWASLIYAFYAFGGIEVIGLMAIRLKKKEEAPKAGLVMLSLLTIIYLISLGLTVTMVSVDQFNPNESPFVTALSDYSLSIFPHLFNGAIIIAGFSTMTAALFGVVTLLVSLSKDGDAPKMFSKKIKKFKDLPLPSLLLATIGLSASIITALLLPEKIYEYITTAAGILLLYNWAFIIISSLRVLDGIKFMNKIIAILGLVLLFSAVSGTLMEKSIRPGFWVSLCIIAIIGLVTIKFGRKKTNQT
ncbi:amino acid permease [Gracilibacillus kekensis]|uniref:Amino acid/polyamine/organocation transporter, APC superfamily n=1 Tax=Gracilibacillus kekensis TaxID=1027249 RepID=A0A1M7Q7H6_9BACI|nr:amino acid permease [Gracilibacillus kekensis]SHN26513.1 amino acid/polyamine/organocation transporter, APC superfamily [Gracilibacillus kekensis]